MRVCRACGQTNEEQERFCVNCGRFLEFTGEELASGPPPGSAGPPSGPPLGTPPPRIPPTPSGRPVDQADVPTGELPAVGVPGGGAAVSPPAAPGTWASPSRLGPSDSASAVPPGGIRPSDVQEGGRQRAPDVVERQALAPGELPCPRCGTGNTGERTFCRRCGERLRFDPVPVAAPPPRQDSPRRSRRGLVAGLLAVAVLAAAGVAAWRLWPRNDATTGANPEPNTTATSGATTPPSAAPAAAARCPDGQELAGARSAIPDFAFDPDAPAGTHVVAQYLTAQWVTSICRDGDGGYWYFNRSRDPARAWEGVLSRAQVSGTAFVATYPGGGTQYVAGRQGTAVVGVGVDPLQSFVCASPAELPPGFLDPAASPPPPCSPDTATPWALP